MKEVWKSIPAWEGYSVSDIGRIRSEERLIIRSNGRPFTVSTKILAAHQDSKGYLQFHPYKDKKRFHVLVHRCVFEAFVRPLEPGEQIDHMDNNKLNNYVDNLQALKGGKEHWQYTWGRIFKKHYDQGVKDGFKKAREQSNGCCCGGCVL